MARATSRAGAAGKRDRAAWSMPLLLLALPALLSCSVTGSFGGGPWFRQEWIELNPDGSFRYVDWSDDGGRICSAMGTWERTEGNRIVRTTVTKVIAGTQPACPRLETVSNWQLRGSRLRRTGLPDLRRTSKRMPADLTGPWL